MELVSIKKTKCITFNMRKWYQTLYKMSKEHNMLLSNYAMHWSMCKCQVGINNGIKGRYSNWIGHSILLEHTPINTHLC